MKRTHTKLFIALLAALLLVAGCGDDADETAVEYKVLGGRLVWCSGGAADMTVPGNASSIGNNAFGNYDTIRTMTIPATVTHIMSGTFSGVKVETIYFGGTYDEWDTMVDGFGFTLDGTPVICADGKTWIWTASAEPDVPVNPDDWQVVNGVVTAYTGTDTTVTFPEGVTAIAPGAFAGSGITEIEYKGDSSAWNELVEAGGIADELDGITVNCADGTWTPAHVHTWGEEYTDDENGGHYRTCSECGTHKTEKHACDVTDNGDGTHTVSCTKCDYADRAEHRYEDDTCAVCGCPNPTAVYVASTGSDTSGDGSKSKPFATIAHAASSLNSRTPIDPESATIFLLSDLAITDNHTITLSPANGTTLNLRGCKDGSAGSRVTVSFKFSQGNISSAFVIQGAVQMQDLTIKQTQDS
ncbi:MAG: leucine-rich repeat protein, partial [Treponema sp.]|nr:leucine-rich repeat protein [Treponema sp.]